MQFINGFVVWDQVAPQEEKTFMDMCAPHVNPPRELNQFLEWLKMVINKHIEDGGEKLLYAGFLAGLIAQLPLATAATDSASYLSLTQRVMRDSRSSPHELSSTRQVGNATFLH